jgi:hypothetical protein
MTRTKKVLVTLAIAAATAGGTAAPALADSHMPVTPQGDSHMPVTPQGDSHMPTPPLADHAAL